MIQTTAQFDGLRSFEAMAEDMVRLTGRSRETIVRNAARDFCRAALRITPMADPRHKPDAKHWVVLYHRYTGELVKFPGTAGQVRKYGVGGSGARIRNRGFAKSAWVGCLRKLGVNVRTPGDRAPESRAGELLMSEVLTVKSKDAGYIEVANQTPPIVPLDQGNRYTPAHHIADRAMADTLQRMNRTLRKLAARQEGRWRK